MTRSSSPPPTPYASEVLRLYALLPDTPDEPRPADRRLALALERRRVPLKLIRAALLLGAARRAASPRAPLQPICSLYYFLPILEEVQNDPPDPRYLDHVRERLRTAGRSPESGQRR